MKTDTCKTCKYFKLYYYQKNSGYMSLDYGYCSMYDKQMGRKEVCENYRYDDLREKRRESDLKMALDIYLNAIHSAYSVIRQMEADKKE